MGSSSKPGIAWSEDHVFRAFRGEIGAIDRIDFHDWHLDGVDRLAGTDHPDGEILRYAEGEALDAAGDRLYRIDPR